jgi:photosystem II stability/assembly factor-like uncharacterized protein
VTPEENELRRALELRSGTPSAEFRSRLTQSLGTRPAPPNLMPAVAFATAVVLTLTSVGILVAAGQLGRTRGAASGARVVSPISNATVIQLSTPSTNVAWALADHAHLYRSTDLGISWNQRSMPSDSGTKSVVSFIDDHEGWLLAPGSPTTHCQAGPADIWHTVDAGTTWARLGTQGIASSQCKNGIWFFDSRHGVVVAWDEVHAATIYRTFDGGKTWAATKLLPDPPNYQSAQGGVGYQVAWMKGFGANLYLGAAGTPYIYRSTDGGASWKWFTKVGSPETVMVTETRWLDLTVPGQAMESVNGGQQFHQYVSDFTTNSPGTTQFLFADARVGYATTGGSVQQTLDGGQHWVTVIPPEGRVITPSPSPSVSPSSIPMPTTVDLSAPSSSVVWALVAGQYLFRSTDQGNTWQRRTMPEFKAGGAAKAHITFVNDQDGWVFFVVETADCTTYQATPTRKSIPEGVQVYRTTDGAATWTLVDSAVQGQVSAGGLPLEQCKTAFDFSDPQHGLVGTTDLVSSYMWRTSDGGVTWTQAELPHPAGWVPGNDRPYSIKSSGGTEVVYAPGDVFESTDGGATWARVGGYPPPLVIVSPTRWLVIFPGSTSETLDAGKTWHDLPTDYHTDSTGFELFVFATDKVGYGTDLGKVMRTLDGGAHWELIKTSWP